MYSFKNLIYLISYFIFISCHLYAQVNLTAPGTLDKAGETYILSNNIFASGTAFEITENDIVLDLNQYVITYNTESSSERVYGVYIDVGVDRITVKNGTIIQGDGKTSKSSAIYLRGASWVEGPHEFHHLVIQTHGDLCYAITAPSGNGFPNSKVHHTYLDTRGGSSEISKAPDGIYVENKDTGGIEIYNNICVNGHKGINFFFLANEANNPERTKITNNLIQNNRNRGTKAPYGIHLYRTRNVDIENNQVVTENGRGIMLDSQTRGAVVRNNIVDVKYKLLSTSGEYIENNVYGLRDRYSSGSNTIENNTFIVDNDVRGNIRGMYVGSDNADSEMKNININNNRIIAWDQEPDADSTPYIFYWDAAEQISVTGNEYYTTGNLQNSTSKVNNLNFDNNTEIILDGYTPKAPSNLRITKFLNSYLLQWDDNLQNETQTFKYIIYKNNEKIDIDPRGGTFFVDVDGALNGANNYSVSAMNLSGIEGPKSAAISVSDAVNAWWDNDETAPNPPANIRVVK